MLIQGIKSGLQQTVTPEEWEQMQSNGFARNFKVVNSSEEPSETPAEVAEVDFPAMVKEAAQLFKDEKYEEAKELYLKAAEIKETPAIRSKLLKIEELLAE